MMRFHAKGGLSRKRSAIIRCRRANGVLRSGRTRHRSALLYSHAASHNKHQGKKMKHGIRVVGLLSAMLLTGSVWAQDYDDGGDKVQASDIAHALSGRPWYVSGMFSYVDSDSDRGSKAGLGGIVSEIGRASCRERVCQYV